MEMRKRNHSPTSRKKKRNREQNHKRIKKETSRRRPKKVSPEEAAVGTAATAQRVKPRIAELNFAEIGALRSRLRSKELLK